MKARTRMMILVLAVALLGFLSGTRAVVGAPAEPITLGAGSVEADALRGDFWRPAGSDAERPVIRLEPVAWTPSDSERRGPEPGALASMQAVVRLASID